MEDEAHVDFNRGLAEEEKKDLEKLLGVFKEERLSPSFDPAQEDLQKQVASLKEKISRMSVVLLDLDKKVHSLYEIVRLFHRKTEVMNERISDVIKLLKKDKQP
jgi:peptidoglycan hydrolase CwlO-like protein